MTTKTETAFIASMSDDLLMKSKVFHSLLDYLRHRKIEVKIMQAPTVLFEGRAVLARCDCLQRRWDEDWKGEVAVMIEKKQGEGKTVFLYDVLPEESIEGSDRTVLRWGWDG